MRGEKNCIRSNHIRERHRVLRNQLNGEELASWREAALGRSGWKGLKKERERERGGEAGEGRRADCSVKWMERGKTNRQTAKDGTCSNQGISREYIRTYSFSPTSRSFFRFSLSISSPLFPRIARDPIPILYSSSFTKSFRRVQMILGYRNGAYKIYLARDEQRRCEKIMRVNSLVV